jgi:methionyl-tRNA formyltransferase
MRVIFMGTPAFAVPSLQALIASAAHEVVAVYCQPPRAAGRGHKLQPSAVQQVAQQAGIEVFTPTSLKDAQAQAQFAAHGADVAVVAAYGLLLPPAILAACPRGCINIHPSDLPRWRGAAPIQRSIMAGDRHTALCIMQMDAGLDSGAVLLREPMAIPASMDAGALHDCMAQKGAQAVLRVLANPDAYPPIAQQGEAVYAAKITKADLLLDLQTSATSLCNQIRGLAPAPAARILLGGEEVKCFAAHISATPDDAGLSLQCGDGKYLVITELQRPNKKRMSAREALRGWQLSTEPAKT